MERHADYQGGTRIGTRAGPPNKKNIVRYRFENVHSKPFRFSEYLHTLISIGILKFAFG